MPYRSAKPAHKHGNPIKNKIKSRWSILYIMHHSGNSVPRSLLRAQRHRLGKRRQCSVQCCFTSTETTRLIRDGEPRTATSTFTQLLSSVSLHCVQVQCCFTSTETTRLVRDGKPRTATSTSTQFLSSVVLALRFTSVFGYCQSVGTCSSVNWP